VRKLKIGKSNQLDSLALAAGELYTRTLVGFWRTVNHKGIWLKPSSLMRWHNSSNLHAHSADAVVQSFCSSLKSWRLRRKTDPNAHPPKRKAKFYKVQWKDSAIRLKNVKRLVAMAMLIIISPTQLAETSVRVTPPKPVVKKVSQPVKWRYGSVTVYADCFEDRTMANGKTFHHRDHVVACRGGQLGQRVEIRYGRNGRTVATICDRGRLPLHRQGQWQFDVTKHIARDLGLYRIKAGKTDRTIKWRYIK
jgi:rare lipoprotein A (peptidoglycan hydrolase)